MRLEAREREAFLRMPLVLTMKDRDEGLGLSVCPGSRLLLRVDVSLELTQASSANGPSLGTRELCHPLFAFSSACPDCQWRWGNCQISLLKRSHVSRLLPQLEIGPKSQGCFRGLLNYAIRPVLKSRAVFLKPSPSSVRSQTTSIDLIKL